MQYWIRSVKVFLLGFLLMLLLFWWGSYLLFDSSIAIDTWWMYILFALQQFLTLCLLWYSLAQWWRKGVDWFVSYLNERNQRKWWKMFWKRVVWWFFLYMILNALLFSFVDHMWWTIPWLYGDQWVMTMLQDMQITWVIDWIMTILMIVIVGPIVEELVYRWLITDALMQRRRWWWVIAAAFIFALIHMEFAVFWNLFFLALILWVIYYKTGSMRYSFLFHLIINGMWILVLRLSEMGYVEGIQ